MRRRIFLLFFILFLLLAFSVMGLSGVLDLLYYGMRSFVRMLSAYVVSIIFSFVFGVLIIHNKKAYEYVFPILDILQAVPILGFFPFAIMFFVLTFPGGILGQELSSVFLIVTSMTWAVVFAVVESGSSLTGEIRDLAKMMDLKGVRYITHMVLPNAFPQFISGSITGWGGGWYFLVASEYLALGDNKLALPGLGAFIAKSAFGYNILYSVIGIAMLAFLVFGMDLYIWQPLLRRARGYSFQPIMAESHAASPSDYAIPRLFEQGYEKFCSVSERVQSSSEKLLSFLSITPANSTSYEQVSNTVSYVLTGSVFAIFLFFLFVRMPSLLANLAILSYVGHSVARILVAFAITLVWTSLFAIFLARNKKAMALMMPVFDLGQSIPAVSIFPVIVIVVVQMLGATIGMGLGLEIASILLVLTGMQWYLLFNLIRAVQNIPDDIMDVAKLLNIRTLDRLKNILIPAIMPSIFVGGLEAMGGGWNASIISEYIISPNGTPYPMEGLGYLLSYSSVLGNLDGVFLAVSGITLLILIPHQLVWKPLVRESYKYKF